MDNIYSCGDNLKMANFMEKAMLLSPMELSTFIKMGNIMGGTYSS